MILCSSKTVTIPFEGIKPSVRINLFILLKKRIEILQPVIDGYRNKCEFSCGKGNNNEGKIPKIYI